MTASKQGPKAGRRERHLPGQPPMHGADRVRVAVNVGELREMTVSVLHDKAKSLGLPCTTKTRKADLIAMIQEVYEARS